MWEGGHTVRRPRAPAGRGSGLYVCSLVHLMVRSNVIVVGGGAQCGARGGSVY